MSSIPLCKQCHKFLPVSDDGLCQFCAEPKFIVKVQRSLAGNVGYESMLIYNEDRTKMYEGEITQDVKNLLGRRPKGYFNAKMVGDKIMIIGEVKAQNW